MNRLDVFASRLLGRSLTADYTDAALAIVAPEVERADALAEQGGHGPLAMSEPTESSALAWLTAVRVLLALPAPHAEPAPGATSAAQAWGASRACSRVSALDRGIVDAALRDAQLDFALRTPDARAQLVRALRSAYQALRSDIDVRSTTRLRATGYGRVLALALAILLVLVRLGSAVFQSPNLARGKPVSASTSLVPARGIVDGKLDGIVGAHTAVDATRGEAFVQIDLMASKPVRKIVVFNRGDRNLDDGLPLWIEASEDGTSFHEIARRTQRFGDGSLFAPPWTAKVRETLRYVRIRSNSYVALSEVEVY